MSPTTKTEPRLFRAHDMIGDNSESSDAADNAELAAAAAAEATSMLRDIGKLRPQQALLPGSIETDYWSFTLPLLADGGRPLFFMKIPKSDIRLTRIRTAVYDQASCLEARTEYESLAQLSEFAESAYLPAIKPVLFLANYNAIITEFTRGSQLFERCRAAALWPHTKKGPTLAILAGAGAWLRRFHDATASPGTNLSHDRAALAECIDTLTALASRVIMRKQHRELLSKLKTVGVPPDSGNPVISIPGFEVRNLLISDRGPTPLDPGRLAPAPRAADLAHFRVSLDMLFWGTPWFIVGVGAPKVQIDAFLSGYNESRFGSSARDRLFLAREWIRLWSSGHLILEQAKRYPAGLRWLAAREYVDRRFLSKLSPIVTSLVTG